MSFTVIFLFGLATLATADQKCKDKPGTCQYFHMYCMAGYEKGLCDGPCERRCCLECNATCEQQEKIDAQKDEICTCVGGRCQDITNYCSGFYVTGKCGGRNERQCCLSKIAGPYGNIMDVETTGASSATAQQDKLCEPGVESSGKMAETDAKRLKKYEAMIKKAAKASGIDASIIAAIISRESRAGAALDKNGLGDNGNGYGLMQIDKRHHAIKGGPYSYKHILQATDILIDMIKKVAKKHPKWTKEMQLKGGISAYNAGVKNVKTYDGMDKGTTGNDYANDVVARAQYLKKKHGY